MIVTRIPPSPTGHLHIGTARTALFNYLLAKQNGGKVLFRSEDTDKARSTKEFEQEIIDGLHWLGLTWDNEGDILRQSERSGIYKEYLLKLIDNGNAYISKEESKSNPGMMVEVIRLKNPNKKITFNDLIRGDITFDTTELGDVVIARNIDDALYHFTVVVDDFLMGVTHVMRGDDHISNTPRQILIQEALGIERPVYAHLPLILAPDRSKMSKRHGAVALKDYREMGYVKDAVINFLALLGWNPGTDQELFSLSELLKQFSVDHIHKSGAVFDIKKFNWYNREYLKNYSNEDFVKYLDLDTVDLSVNISFDSEEFKRIVPLIKERVYTRQEAIDEIKAGEYDFAFVAPTNFAVDLLKWKNDKSVKDALPRLKQALSLLENADFSSVESIKSELWSYAEEVGKGELLWPLRIALSGREKSPDPFTIAYIIGRVETIHRIKLACDKIGE
jgi:glutamyl-tRNA synthetase